MTLNERLWWWLAAWINLAESVVELTTLCWVTPCWHTQFVLWRLAQTNPPIDEGDPDAV